MDIRLASFVAVTAIAAYIHSITGFAFALLVMGVIGLTGLVPLTDGAVIVSSLTLINSAILFYRGPKAVAVRPIAFSLLGALPFTFAGYALLAFISSTSLHLLRLSLGLTIIFSGVFLLRRPKPDRRSGGITGFLVYGAISGLMSGLFSISGPPIVYQMYRQPLPIRTIRETLVAIFTVISISRLLTAVLSGHFPPYLFWWIGAACPGVVLASLFAKRWPSPLSPERSRQLVFLLLMVAGVALSVPALRSMIE